MMTIVRRGVKITGFSMDLKLSIYVYVYYANFYFYYFYKDLKGFIFHVNV